MDCWPIMFSKLVLSKPPWQTQLLFHLFSGFLLHSQPAFPCTPPSFPPRAGMFLLAHCLSFGNSTSQLINSSHSCLLAMKKTNPPELQLCSGDFWQSGTVPWCGTRDCAAKPSSVTFSTALEGSLRDSPKIWLQAPFYRWFISVVTLLKSGSLCECLWLQWPLGVCFPSQSPRLWLQGGKVSSLLCCPSHATASPFLHVAISLKK